jgi:hypothetical protein
MSITSIDGHRVCVDTDLYSWVELRRENSHKWDLSDIAQFSITKYLSK